MAYTKIIPVRNHLERCLNYTANPDKTEVFSGEEMKRLLKYTQNGDKTEYQLYVAGFNCDPATAFSTMQRTKKRWNKTEGTTVLAYHIIQSFQPGEVTPEICFRIGCEFAKRFLSERFECTVSTHLDRHHLHCHIVLNSVSFVDGRMFRNDFKSYYQGIRKISDDLCREYKLSIIETDGQGVSYGEWSKTHQGKTTVRSLVAEDAERALLAASTYEGFLQELRKMGYKIDASPNHKYTSITPPNRTKAVRLEKLNPKYAESSVREYYHQLRQLPVQERQEYQAQNEQGPVRWMPDELLVHRRYRSYSRRSPSLFRPHKRIHGFMALYYRYCALLRKTYRGKSSRRCYYLLRQDFAKFKRYQEQCHFLWEYHIQTTEDLAAIKANLRLEIDQLLSRRKTFYRQKGGDIDVERTQSIKDLGIQLRELRKELSLCCAIESDVERIQNQLHQIHNNQSIPVQNCEVKFHEQCR